MKKILFVLLGLVIILIAVLLFNTFSLESRQIEADALQIPDIEDSVFIRLGKAIQFRTISFNEEIEPDSAAFTGFHQFLSEAFPKVHQELELTKINTYSLLYTWKGAEDDKKPLILMSHQDVVPVDQPTLADWEAGPFEGAITDTHIIGRGTMDDKGSLMAVLESVEMLLKEGYRPSRTIYLAFGHDEEIGGRNGARKIADYLEEKGVEALMTIDEGGYIADGLVPGVEGSVAFINLAEKGYASYRLIVETAGGHSSNPPENNTIGMLAQAIVDLEDNQRPYKLVPSIETQLEYLGPELPFGQRLAASNLWLFKMPFLQALNAHTTTAPTIIEGGIKSNVIPTVAEATVNFRILPGETTETVLEHIRRVIGDEIRIEPVGFMVDPSPVSSVESEGFLALQKTIRGAFPGTIVVPGLVGGGTDARYFYDISEDVYRFYPLRLHSDNLERFHGIDEKISKENYRELVSFTYHLIRNLD